MYRATVYFYDDEGKLFHEFNKNFETRKAAVAFTSGFNSLPSDKVDTLVLKVKED